MKHISIAMATYNEAENLKMSLASVQGLAAEIVIVDGGSRDATVAVAKAHGAIVIETNNPAIFHINKQKALEACTGKWVFQLDADEVITPFLKDELLSIAKSKSVKFAGYYVPRKNFFLGHWMRKGGQYPDYVIRYFLRTRATVPAKSVHEQIAVEGGVGYLTHPLLHYSYRSLDEYMMKAHRYSDLVATKLSEDNTPKNLWNYILYNSIMPLGTFFNLFVRHKGFVDGYYGFLYAALSGMQHSMAYQKYLKMS